MKIQSCDVTFSLLIWRCEPRLFRLFLIENTKENYELLTLCHNRFVDDQKFYDQPIRDALKKICNKIPDIHAKDFIREWQEDEISINEMPNLDMFIKSIFISGYL